MLTICERCKKAIKLEDDSTSFHSNYIDENGSVKQTWIRYCIDCYLEVEEQIESWNLRKKRAIDRAMEMDIYSIPNQIAKMSNEQIIELYVRERMRFDNNSIDALRDIARNDVLLYSILKRMKNLEANE